MASDNTKKSKPTEELPWLPTDSEEKLLSVIKGFQKPDKNERGDYRPYRSKDADTPSLTPSREV